MADSFHTITLWVTGSTETPYPTIVYLELVTNNLDSNLSAFEVTANKLLQSDIKVVIIRSVLFKEKTRNIPVQTRRSITRFTNPRLLFWNHPRMYGSQTPLLQHDRTHRTDENGNQRLYRSIAMPYCRLLGVYKHALGKY